MKRILLTLTVLLLSLSLFAAFDASYSDRLFYNQHDYQADYNYLQKELPGARNDSEKADILWRLSRTVLTITDDIDEGDKEARLSGYNEAQSLAEQSIAVKPTANAYHWLASSMGRIGQVNGPLNSLSKAKPMLGHLETVQNEFGADMSDSWYVLGVLYKSLPGAPISFGNNNFAISYMRRCLDTQDNVNRTNLTNYLELSDQLYDRNWDANKRGKEADKMKKNYDKQSVPTEKMKYYEGVNGRNTKAFYSSVALDKMSDRQEAVMLLQYALAVYNSRSVKLESDTAKAAEIQARLNEIT